MRLLLCLCFILSQSACSHTKMPPKASELTSVDETLYAFIGRKVSVAKDRQFETITETVVENGVEREVERKVVSGMDERMIATYDIIQSINGDLKSDTVTFTAYDHWGSFNFANYEYALLLITQYEGKYYLQKYQHDSVFKTADGRWAGCGESPIDAAYYKVPEINAVNIKFSPEVKFGPHDPPPTSQGIFYEAKQLEEYWNSPTFDIVGNNAICKKGIYAEDLFKLRMDTVMKARAEYDK